jgi:hypothetical protein
MYSKRKLHVSCVHLELFGTFFGSAIHGMLELSLGYSGR